MDVKAFKAGQIELTMDFEAGWLCRQLILLWNTVIGIIQGRLAAPHVFPCFFPHEPCDGMVVVLGGAGWVTR